MTTSLKGQPPSSEVRAQLAAEGRPVILAFSRGKDSIAAWLALKDAGVDVRPFYLYLVPGLKFERLDLERWEATFNQPIPTYPHPGLYRWLRNLVFQPPDRWRSILAADLPKLTHEIVNARVREDFGLPPDTWIADGVRANDSLVRRASLATHGVFKPRLAKVSPVWDWSTAEVRERIAAAGLKLPVDYDWFGRSFDGLDLRFLGPLKEHAPDDYARVLEWFPLAELELFRVSLTA
jgi:3'-phosphoadenosine 5'-phosphosulfate sulfotransferase (PAPS reductase)/FAD synthetase